MTTNLPLSGDLARRYVAGRTTPAETLDVERAMDASPRWRALVGSQVDPARLDLVLAGVVAELDAPKRGVIERLMVRLGLHEHVARLMAATPVLRRSWYLASILVLLFGLAAADPDRPDGSLAVFLVVAPLVPVLGVGLAYGPGVDPASDMTVATPLSGFRLLLLRSVTVLATSVLFGGIGAILIAPDHGLRVLAWMLPALALTTATLALATAVPTRLAAGLVAGGWLAIVIAVTRLADDLALFGGPAQPLYLALALVAGVLLAVRREVFEQAELHP